MTKQTSRHGIGIGSASMLLVLLVLALTVFAVLTLVSSNNELKTARISADSSRAYYAAETEALEKYVMICETIDGVFSEEELPIALEPLGVSCRPDGIGYEITYDTEIDSHRKLRSTLSFQMGTLSVIGWKTVGEGEEIVEEPAISVWDGQGLPFEN